MRVNLKDDVIIEMYTVHCEKPYDRVNYYDISGYEVQAGVLMLFRDTQSNIYMPAENVINFIIKK